MRPPPVWFLRDNCQLQNLRAIREIRFCHWASANHIHPCTAKEKLGAKKLDYHIRVLEGEHCSNTNRCFLVVNLLQVRDLDIGVEKLHLHRLSMDRLQLIRS